MACSNPLRSRTPSHLSLFFSTTRVKLFVEQLEGGVRVTDRGTTAMRLTMAEVNLTSKPAEDVLQQSVAGDLLA